MSQRQNEFIKKDTKVSGKSDPKSSNNPPIPKAPAPSQHKILGNVPSIANEQFEQNRQSVVTTFFAPPPAPPAPPRETK